MASSVAVHDAERLPPLTDTGVASKRSVASLVDDLLTAPARVSRTTRFAVVTLLDGLMVILTFQLVLSIAGGPLARIFAAAPSLVWLFTLSTVAGFSLIGLNWRSWRCISVPDFVALGGALLVSLFLAWSVLLLVAPPLRFEWSAAALIGAMHAELLLLTMFGTRALRRAIGDHVRERGASSAAEPRQDILLLGSLEWIKSVAELVKADRNRRVRVVGALSFDSRAIGIQVAGVPVLGTPVDLPRVTSRLARRGARPASIIVADEQMQQSAFAQLLALAGQCDLAVTRGPQPQQRNGRSLPFSVSDLLDRPEITLQRDMVERLIRRRRVLVTGAGGTIGSELVRQLATFGPAELVLLDHCEFNLYSIDMHVREHHPDIVCHGELCCVRDRASVRRVFEQHQPDIVFHAAALKHVPLVEGNPQAGVHTNVLGTRNVADAVCEFGSLAMVQISTDKAVNPVGLMGATKRLGELYCQALDLIGQCDLDSPRFMTVRFGNVLGSSGSLIPLFERQIAAGKPLTVTHPEIERYFMTVGEAVQLILQSSARALETRVHRGTIFVLDMGDPIKIVDIARRMIRLAGLRPDKDLPIKFIGLRPGEKLFEELFDASEKRLRSSIPGIIEARPSPVPLEQLISGFAMLEHLVEAGDQESIRLEVHRLVQASGRSAWAEALWDVDEDRERMPNAQTPFLARPTPESPRPQALR